MSTKRPRPVKDTDCTDPRPSTIRLGTDCDQSRHYYRTRTETIHVVTAAGHREQTFDVTREAIARDQSTRATLADYMAHVADCRGWASTNYAAGSIADQLADALEADR